MAGPPRSCDTAKTLLWEMESAETELWEEEPDPLLEEVAKEAFATYPVSTENILWRVGNTTKSTVI